MHNLRSLLLDVATVLVVMCTITVTGVTMFRLLNPAGATAAAKTSKPTLVKDWKRLAETGHRLGPDSADVTVVVFSDFECPMCKTFATSTFPAFQEMHPGRIAMVYRHWPLSQHKFAYPAARASECAAEQGKFAAYHDLLYEQQEQLGLKSLREFALEVGLPNMASFDECYKRADNVSAIEQDIRDVNSLGGTGTPTIVLNGWLLRGGATTGLLDSIARQFLTRNPAAAR